MSSENKHYHSAYSPQAGHAQPCPQLPGTIVRIFIPAGAVINVLNILELSSPTGVCLILRIPVLQGGSPAVQSFFNSIKQAGGTVQVANV